MSALTWKQLAPASLWPADKTNGPTNSQSELRLFGRPKEEVRVTLFRDNHAWCPYCQKVWMFLEEKRIPYKIRKVTMFCYGEKEQWYKRIVPNGMLPAVQIDGKTITESDEILFALEDSFGPLGAPLGQIMPLRRLERGIFRAWCGWLCYPQRNAAEEKRSQEDFEEVLGVVDKALAKTSGPFFLEDFSIADCVFLPYMERMLASLYYYKGFNMKEKAPNVHRWFKGLESRETYRGTQSDLLTHVHDLPPQMGGCYHSNTPQQRALRERIDNQPYLDHIPDVDYPEPKTAVEEAIARVVQHKDNVIAVNPVKNKKVVDEALRAALTTLKSGVDCPAPGAGGDVALRYIRDRLNAPRDMSIWAARRMREACERSAALAGDGQPARIAVEHRRDSDPLLFKVDPSHSAAVSAY